MSRTRLSQVEQVINSELYDDNLNQGTGTGAATEGQPSDSIGSNNAIVSTTTTTIVVGQNLIALGLNKEDQVTVTGSASNNGTYIITNLSYSSPNTTITVNPVTIDGSVTLSAGGASGNAQAKIDYTKSLQRDMNHIRTQLRKLNQQPNWYDDPAELPVYMFATSTSVAIAAGTAIDVGANYNAGTPFDLNVYLNGELLLPSVITGNAITTQYDYQELDQAEALVEVGDVGRKIAINFDLVSGDVLQFVWTL